MSMTKFKWNHVEKKKKERMPFVYDLQKTTPLIKKCTLFVN